MGQLLVTLPNGEQVLIQGITVDRPPRVIHREAHFLTWGTEFDGADVQRVGQAHVPGTYHVGEY